MVSKIKTASITADAVDNTILDLADNFAFTGTVTGAGGGFTFVTAQTLNGESSRTFTGIPSGVNIIRYYIWRHSGSTTALLRIQIGDSGGIETSGYSFATHYNNNGGANLAVSGGTDEANWELSAWNSAANVLHHAGECVRVDGNKWILKSIAMQGNSSPDYIIDYRGNKELSAELTQIKFFLSAGTFDDSNSLIRIGYQ